MEDSGEGSGRAGNHRSCTAGRGVQPAGPPVLDSERGPSAGEGAETGAEPLRNRMKSQAPVSVFWN